MINPLDDLNFSRNQKSIEELEKLAGFSPNRSGSNKFTAVADSLVKKTERPAERGSEPEIDKYWDFHKSFVSLYERAGRSFALFIGDLLDIILGGPVQTRLVNDMIEEKINRMRKAREAAAEPSTQKHKVQARRNSKYDVVIGGEKRVFSRHFLKRKGFLAALFLDSDEYPSFKKLVRQIEIVCRESLQEDAVPDSEDARLAELKKIVENLRYEISQAEVVHAWALLEADGFKHLEWAFNETRSLNLVRPNFYEDLDKAYRDGKKLIKLLIEDIQTEFPPTEDKQDAYEDYLNNILEIYTHHHFVLKYFNQTRPSISLKDFEMTREELHEKIQDLREESDEMRRRINQVSIEKDQALAEARALRTQNEELRQKLARLDPVEVQKQLQSAEAKVRASRKELEETIKEEEELREDMLKLDQENQELTRRLQALHAIPDEDAYSVAGLLQGKRVVIFGGVGRDHYLPILKEAGVANEDYEWYEGYHTISQARTAEIVGRCDLAVVVTSYAGHLLLYQVRPCIKEHQHFFKIHNSGAGSLRKEILKTFKK
ncbi:MAG TPA: hypothetical protein PLK28_04320 [Candidatus Rifleibacterium sp.]|nr:hypothetical protein [Candidatus Rifleibacterium sp.]HOI89719.1 hypothetical protein [Candidatus Rifleibacterium sp.]HPW59135.1 hypothetical protein [Candidatus Rifleibacterium sp.]